MLHASFVRAHELPADVTLYEVDSLFPVICDYYGGKHDEVGFDNLVCNGIIGVNNGETDVPVICVVWYFCGCPVWFVGKGYIFEEGVGFPDFLQECFLGPKLTQVHSIAVEFFVGDCPAWNLSVYKFVPYCRFGKRNMGVTLSEDIDDGLGCVFNIFVFGFVCESDREVILFSPSGEDSFDFVHLLTGYVDFVDNNVCWGLYAFPWGIPTEAEGVDLPVLECRSFGCGIDWSSGFVWSVLTSCC